MPVLDGYGYLSVYYFLCCTVTAFCQLPIINGYVVLCDGMERETIANFGNLGEHNHPVQARLSRESETHFLGFMGASASE